MSRTRENILSDIEKAKENLVKLREEDRKNEENCRNSIPGSSEAKYWRDRMVDTGHLGRKPIEDNIKELEEELKEYDRDPVAYERNYLQKVKSNKLKKLESAIEYYEKEIKSEESTISYERSMNFRNSPDKIYACEQFIKSHKKSLAEARENLRKFRNEQYWEDHQQEREQLESEKESLNEQIESLNRQISEIPKNEGHDDIIELEKSIQALITQKNALGFFNFKEKNALEAQIDSTAKEISLIFARINSATEATQEKIWSLKNKINVINAKLDRRSPPEPVSYTKSKPITSKYSDGDKAGNKKGGCMWWIFFAVGVIFLIVYVLKSSDIFLSASDKSKKEYSEGMAAVTRGIFNRKWGFKNESGNTVIPCVYTVVNRFSEGLAAVKKDGKWGYIDKSGNTVIQFKFNYEVGAFRNGYARVGDKIKTATPRGWDILYGLIDRSGNMTVPCKYYGFRDINGDLAIVRGPSPRGTKGNMSYGVVNIRSGREVIPCIHGAAISFKDDLIVVGVKDPQYFDKSGNRVNRK